MARGVKKGRICLFIALSKIFLLFFYSAVFCATLQLNEGKANKKFTLCEKKFKKTLFMVKKRKRKPPFFEKKGVFQGI